MNRLVVPPGAEAVADDEDEDELVEAVVAFVVPSDVPLAGRNGFKLSDCEATLDTDMCVLRVPPGSRAMKGLRTS